MVEIGGFLVVVEVAVKTKYFHQASLTPHYFSNKKQKPPEKKRVRVIWRFSLWLVFVDFLKD